MTDPWIGATPYARHCRPKLSDLLTAVGLDVTYTRARGAYLYRAGADGREVPVLDLVGGFGAGLLGHNHPELKRRLAEALQADVPFLAQSSEREAAGQLAERLSGLLPGNASYIGHFTNSGAEAIEAALKHAYKVRFDVLRRLFDQVARDTERFLREAERDCPDVAVPGASGTLSGFRDDLDEYNIAEFERFQTHPVVLTMKGAFHGKTASALKVTFNKTYREGFEGMSAIEPVFLDYADVERLEEIVAAHQVSYRIPMIREGRIVLETRSATTVIALCLEIIQGEGGMRPLSENVLATLAEVHGRLGVPYLLDEIQTGCGRTGTFVAYADGPLAATTPEYVTLSKALGGGLVKIGVALIRDDIYDQDFGVLHTSTFAEDELSCAVAHGVLDVLTDADGQVMRDVTAKGLYLRAQLEQLRARFPSVIRDVRGKGLMLGLEFTDLADCSPLFRFGIRQGFLSLLVASYLLYHHQIRLLAPLTTVLKGNPGKRRHAVLRLQPAVGITKDDMDRVVQALAEVCLIIERNNEGVLVGHLVGATPDESERRDPPQVAVTVPRLDRRTDFDARVGFIVHPASIDQILRYYLPSLLHVDRKQVAAWWSRLARFLEPDVVHSAYIGANGFRVEANMVAVPYLASDLARTYGAVTRCAAPSRYDVLRLEAIRDKIQDAVTTARELGDDQIPTSVVGLGAYTSIVTDQGTTVNDFDVPVTTGNAYTAGLMLEGIAEAASRQGLVLARTDAAVVGAAGNIGSVLAVLLAGRVRTLRLVGRDTPDSRARLERTRLACLARRPDAVDRVTVHVSLEAVRSCDVVTVATNSPEARLIGPDLVKRGAVVSCASVPSNLSAAFKDHLQDFLVFDGGYARLPEGQVIDCIGLPQGGLAFGCLSETLLLGFAGCDQSFARGPIAPEQVEAMLALARQYGFTLGEFKLNEAPYSPPPRGAI